MLHTTKLLSSARFFRVVSNCLSLAFLLFLFALLSPVTPELSSAAPTSAVSDQAAVEFSTSVIPAVSVAVESSVNLDVAPSSTGSFATTPTTVTVSTNSREGYSLFLEASGETNALLPQLNKDNPATIVSLDTNTTEANFPVNHWGVNLSGSSDYQPVPIDATDAIVSSSTANAADTYTLNFAVKIDDTLPVDTYSGSVLLSAVANPVAAHNLAELVYMQNMTHEICENTADYVDVDHYVTKQLIDTRDGKSYWVAKLADGNCWMVQNLGLALSTAQTLNNTDTDLNIQTSWTPSANANAIQYNGSKITLNASSTHYWDFGEIVLATPTRNEQCNNYGTNQFGNHYSAKFNDQLYNICASYGFVNVSGDNWRPDFTAQPGTFMGTEYDLVAINPVNASDLSHGGTYDPHYLIGNYYQQNATTAGTAMSVLTANDSAPDSICPKGWKLPTAPRQAAASNYLPIDQNGSFYNLLLAYGYPENNAYNNPAQNTTNASTPILNGAGQNPFMPPFYLANFGVINLDFGYLLSAGGSFDYTSSTYTNASFYTYFNNNITQLNGIITPTSTGPFLSGYSVRCLAR